MSKPLEEYPEEREDGKVLNPLTSNWVQQDYAVKQGILEQAKENTQKHFRDQDDTQESVSDEIDQLLKEAEEAEPGEAFKLDEDDLEDLSDEDLRRLDEHAELPDSPFPDQNEFDPDQGAEPDTFQQPPTPEGLENAAQRQGGGQGSQSQGIYSGQSAGRQARTQSNSDNEQSMQEKHENDDVRYVKTEHGGMKMVYPNENNDE